MTQKLASAHVAFVLLLIAACNGFDTGTADAVFGAITGPIVLYASPAGSGSECTSAAPCSLVGARDKVRTLNGNMQADITVNLKDGLYVLASPLILRETQSIHDSGTNGYDVIYQAEPGTHPVLSGGTRIRGWTLWDAARNIYRASVAPGLQARQLYVNGVRATRARSENDGTNYRYFTDVSTGFEIADGSLAEWRNQSDIEVVSQEAWKTSRCPVASIARQHWRNVVAKSSGNGFGFEFSNRWSANDYLPDAGQGTSYQVGDFNGDGKSDLLFAYQHWTGHWHNEVALSDGHTFASLTNWMTDAGQGTTYYLGDYNGDGKSDLLFAYLDGAGHWRNEVAFSSGSGFYFASPSLWLYDAGRNTQYHVGDYNGDGRSDLLFAYAGDDGHWHNVVALSTGSGFFFPTIADWLPDFGRNTEYHIGDYNHDGTSDLLFSYLDDAGHWHNDVALSDGRQFQFSQPRDWLPNVGQNATYHIADFNGDGASDLLLVSQDAVGNWHNNVAISDGVHFVSPTDWLPNVGLGAAYQVGDFFGDPVQHYADVLFSGYDAMIAMQQPCWSDTHSEGGNPGLPPDPYAYYNMNTLTWLENALELLDLPGEWYLDRTAGYVYYRPRSGEDLATASVVAATQETLISGSGEVAAQERRFLAHIQFRNMTFAYAGWFAPNTDNGYSAIQAGWHGSFVTNTQFDPLRTPGSVTFSVASNLRFEGNIFTHLGAVGLNLDSGSRHTSVVGNVFRDISSSAIQIGDVSETNRNTALEAEETMDNTVMDNFITDAATEYQDAVGVFVGYSVATTISHNEIANLPYSGISVGWGWGWRPDATRVDHPETSGPACEPDSYAAGNSITGNRIHDVMLSLIDGGAIYTQGSQPGSMTSSNYVTGSPAAEGIYHDQGTCYYTDTNNVIEGVYQWLSMWESASIWNNTVHNNYVDADSVYCFGNAGSSDLCNNSAGSGRANSAYDNTFTGGNWPAPAQAIINQSGLEPAYLGIKSAICGDATCNEGETAASCPKDCL